MNEPTQTRKPWNAVARTILAGAVAIVPLLPILPDILAASGLAQTSVGVWLLAALGAVTRVLAVPGVNEWLRRHVPILSAQGGKPGA